MRFLVVTIKSWNVENFLRLTAEDKNNEWHLITDKDDFNIKKVQEINPKLIFFPHWSWIIPKEIYEKYECVVFHMTDLPYGRGGSPLQNLIVRGHKSSKLSVLKVAGELDAGPIYTKRDLDLSGTAEDILKRVSDVTFSVIKEMANKDNIAIPQQGEIVKFARRKPEDGDLSVLVEIEKVYDYIRMLDAEGYPLSFLEKNNLRLEFKEAKLLDGKLEAKVFITIKQ